MYKVVFSEKADKQFGKLEQSTQQRIISVLERIRIRPESYVKKLVGSPYFRLRVGDYRVILNIRTSELIILVIHVGHRENIYKKLA